MFRKGLILCCIAIVFAMDDETKKEADNSEILPGGISDARFGMLADMAGIPGVHLDKEILMRMEPHVLERLINTLTASGLATQATAFQQPKPTVNIVEEINTCPDNDEDGIDYYCKDMPQGLYHDPWNPWCGYIKCDGGIPYRQVCQNGSWMDVKKILGMGTKDLCHLPLDTEDEEKACNMYSDMYLCKNAERLMENNKKK